MFARTRLAVQTFSSVTKGSIRHFSEEAAEKNVSFGVVGKLEHLFRKDSLFYV